MIPTPDGFSEAILGSTIPRWFSVLVAYPTDQALRDYRILAVDRGSLHRYNVLGWPFEVLMLLVGVVALMATLYGEVADDRAKGAANAVIGSGAAALGAVLIASITFEIANPRSEGLVLGSDLRVGLGVIAAARAGGLTLIGGVLTRRSISGRADAR